MKKTIVSAAVALAAIACGNSAFAQGTSTATAVGTANIVTPISITHGTDMVFANVTPGSSLGTVVMAPASGSAGRTFTGGVTLPATTGATPSAAHFTVAGETGLAYTITLPGSAASLTNASNPAMSLDTWTVNASAGAGYVIGTDVDIYVGAKLHVGANQPAAAYTSSTFDVMVSY